MKNNVQGRMLFVLVTANKVEVEGEALGEDLGGDMLDSFKRNA